VRNNHTWTDEERAIIRRDYKHTRQSCERLAEYLSQLTGEKITRFGVRGQISIMGIARSDDRRAWSPEEDAKLRELIPTFCPRVVARRMHRSLNSIVNRSTRLKISRRCRNGWFTKNELMAILGHDHKWIQRRIDSGALKALLPLRHQAHSARWLRLAYCGEGSEGLHPPVPGRVGRLQHRYHHHCGYHRWCGQ